MDFFKILADLAGNEAIVSNTGRNMIVGGHGQATGGVAVSTQQAPSGTAAPTACPCCDGKGAFDLWGRPCEKGHMHEKMDCPTCDGRCYFVGADAMTRCPKCDGKGGINHWGKPCTVADMHFESNCPTCAGKAYLAPQVTAPGRPQETTTAAHGRSLGGLLGGMMGNAIDQAMQHRDASSASSLPRQADAEFTNDHAAVLIRAMVNAAKCDGRIDEDEQRKITSKLGDTSSEGHQFLLAEFARPLDVDAFAAEVPIGMEEQVYIASLTAIDLDKPAEVDYLRHLARALRLGRSQCEEIHLRLGAPVI